MKIFACSIPALHTAWLNSEVFSKGWVWIKTGCDPENQTQDADVKIKFGAMGRLFSDMKR